MRDAQKNTKLALDGLVSFLIWTSVAVMGILISSTLFRFFVAGSLAAYHWVRP